MEDLDTFKQMEDILAGRSEETPAAEGTEQVAAVEDSADEPAAEPTVEDEPEAQPESRDLDWRDPRIKWDGLEQVSFEDRGSLPPPVQKKLAAADRYFAEQNQKLVALQRQYQEALTKLADGPAKVAPESEGPPKPPPAEASEQEYDQYVAERAAYAAREAVKEQLREVEELRGQVSAIRQREEQADVDRRLGDLRKLDGYSEEVEATMAQMASASDHWKLALKTDEGLKDLFGVALQRIKAQQSQTDQVKLQTTAASRAVSKPGAKGATTRAKADIDADSIGGVMEQLARSGEFGPELARAFD